MESEFEEIRIVSKYDYELSKGEIKKIFSIYNECFYDFRCSSTKLIKKAHHLIGSTHVWRWYLAYLGSELIGIAAYVYDTSFSDDLDINVNVSLGENICNVGVRSRFRRRGVAKSLMEAIIDDYCVFDKELNKDLVVEVINGSKNYMAVMNLYNALGFESLKNGEFDTEKVRYLICSSKMV